MINSRLSVLLVIFFLTLFGRSMPAQAGGGDMPMPQTEIPNRAMRTSVNVTPGAVVMSASIAEKGGAIFTVQGFGSVTEMVVGPQTDNGVMADKAYAMMGMTPEQIKTVKEMASGQMQGPMPGNPVVINPDGSTGTTAK